MAQRTRTTTRFAVVRAFDYVSADREYDFTTTDGSRTVDVRRTDGSGVGTYVAAWQFKQAVSNGWVRQVAS